MLNRPNAKFGLDPSAQNREADDSIDFDWLLAVARRRFWVIVGSGVIFLILGVAYLLTAVPQYSAFSDILVDQRRINAVQDAYALTDLGTSNGALESEVEVVNSERVARRVVEDLDLINNAAFNHPPSSPLGNVIGGITGGIASVVTFVFGNDIEEITESERAARQNSAAKALRKMLNARRVGTTYVMRVTVTHPDPNLAARLSNAVADAYINDQMESAFDATRQASEWLQSRIQELQQKSISAEQAVQDFMAQHNLAETSNQSFADQQLSALNSQLIAQRAKTSQLQTRFQHLQSIIDSRNASAVVSEALDNSIINNLRSRYLEDSKRHDELVKLVGPDHLQVKNLEQEMSEYSRLMFAELERIEQSLESDYQVAKAQVAALEQQISEQMRANEGSNSVKAQLAELQRQAKTYSDLHQSYLTRYQELTQQESFPVGQAQILNHAEAPGAPSSPQKTRTLAMALILGLMVGAGGAAFLEYRDRVFRTGDQVRGELQLEFLGNLPLIGGIGGASRRRKRAGPEASKPTDDGELAVSADLQIMRYSLDHPLSGFAETLRAAKVGLDLALPDQQSKIIGVTSLLPGEGKSTVSKNFASLLANQGTKTLLIDADLRHPALTRSLIDKRDMPGLLDAVLDQRQLHELLAREADSGLMFLPSGYRHHVSHTSDILASAGFRALLQTASKVFDYVVVDLPPMGPVVDAKAAASQMSAFVFVVEWGKTARQAVGAALHSTPEVRDKCAGVIYNKTDQNKMKMYANYGGSEYYHSYYNKYYRS